MNHPEVFIGACVFFLMYLYSWAKLKRSITNEQAKKRFEKNPAKYMFIYLTCWLMSLFMTAVLAVMILGISWSLQLLFDNPSVHNVTRKILFNGLLFTNRGSIYCVLVLSFLLIAIINISICVPVVKSVSKSQANLYLRTVIKEGTVNVYYWIYKNRYCTRKPKLVRGKSVRLTLASTITPNALAIINLLLVILMLVLIVIATTYMIAQ